MNTPDSKAASTSRKELAIIAHITLAGVLFFLFMYWNAVDTVSIFWMCYFFSAVFFSVIVGLVGNMRTIGYGKAFLISIVASPLVGFILLSYRQALKMRHINQK